MNLGTVVDKQIEQNEDEEEEYGGDEKGKAGGIQGIPSLLHYGEPIDIEGYKKPPN